MAQYDISDIANYQEGYTAHPSEMFSRYIGVMHEFIAQAVACVTITKIDYFRHIVIKGIENITHVFRMLLLYTHNLELAAYNSKKSVYYFIEFIEQIGHDNHDLLKLSSTDATLFVYKKTIFAINQARRKEHRENDDANTAITKCFFHMTELWLSAMRTSLASKVTVTNDQAKIAIDTVSTYATAINGLIPMRMKAQDAIEHCEVMLAFSDAVKTLPEQYHLELLEIMCRKVDKRKIDIKLVGKAVIDNADKLTMMTPKKFVTIVAAVAIKQTEQFFS